MSGLFPGLPGGFPGLIGGLTGSAPSPYVEYLAALMVSVFINAGFFFAELAFLSSVPAGSVRSRIEALCVPIPFERTHTALARP